MSSSNLYCDVCHKPFSGPACAKQHFESAQHIKKTQIANSVPGGSHSEGSASHHWGETYGRLGEDFQQLNIDSGDRSHAVQPAHHNPSFERVERADQEEPEYEWNGFRGKCNLCNVDFTSVSHKDAHLGGAKHGKKKLNQGYATAKDYYMMRDHAGSAGHGSVVEDDILQVHNWNGVTGGCLICKVQFTSRPHAEQHLTGQNHQKTRRAFENTAQEQKRHKASRNSCGAADAGLVAQKTQLADPDEEFSWDGSQGRCNICSVEFTSRVHKDSHINGKQHAKRKKFWEFEKQTRGTNQTGPQISNPSDMTTWHCCQICKKSMNTIEQLHLHQQSKSHKKKEEQMAMEGTPMSSLALSTFSDNTNWFDCPVCQKKVNSREQLELHVQSHGMSADDLRTEQTEVKHRLERDHEVALEIAKMKAKTVLRSQTDEAMTSSEVRTIDVPHGLTKKGQVVTEPSSYQARKQREISTIGTIHNASEIRSEETDLKKVVQGVGTHKYVPEANDDGLSLNFLPEEHGAHSTVGSKQGENQQASQFVRKGPTYELPSSICEAVPGSHSNFSSFGQVGLSSFVSRGAENVTERVGPDGQCESLSYSDGYHGYPSQSVSEAPLSQYDAPSCFPSSCASGPTSQFDSVPQFLSAQEIVGQESLHLAAETAWLESMPTNLCHPRLVKTATLEDCRERQKKSSIRSYLGELYEKAMAHDTVCFLPAGTGDMEMVCMVVSHMLDVNPRRQAVFLTDRSLQAFNMRSTVYSLLKGREFNRSDPATNELELRSLRIALVCEGQRNIGNLPLWQQDIVVATADSYLEILSNQKTSWESNSVVVLHQAQLCAKSSDTYTRLLRTYHFPTDSKNRPKLLGMLSSVAGKDSVDNTVALLKNIFSKLEEVKLEMVETNKKQLEKYRSNTLIHMIQVDLSSEEGQLHVGLQEYLLHCCLYLAANSNLRTLGMGRKLDALQAAMIDKSEDSKVHMEPDFVLDLLTCVPYISATQAKYRSNVLFVASHSRLICEALLSLWEIGLIGAYLILAGLLKDSSMEGFGAAAHLQLPCERLQKTALQSIESKHPSLLAPELTKDIMVDVTKYPVLEKILSEISGNLEVSEEEEEEDDFNPVYVILVRKPEHVPLVYHIISKSKVVQDSKLKHGCLELDGCRRPEYDLLDFDLIVTCSEMERNLILADRQVVILYLGPTSRLSIVEQLRGTLRPTGSQFLVFCRQNEQKKKVQDIIAKERHIVSAVAKL